MPAIITIEAAADDSVQPLSEAVASARAFTKSAQVAATATSADATQTTADALATDADRIAAETARAGAETAKTQSDAIKAFVITARTATEGARDDAEDARDQANAVVASVQASVGVASAAAISTAADRVVVTNIRDQVVGGAGTTAASTTFAPAGNLSSTNVQAALAELDGEKQPLASLLTALVALATAANKGLYFSGAGVPALFDLTAAARALLDDADAPTMLATLGALGLAGGTLTGALTLSGDPTQALHAVTKQYADGLAQGLDAKQSVKAATTPTAGNITLSGPQTIDGVALVAGDRVLVKNQTSASQNGLYAVASGAWTRTLDADTLAELVSAFVFIEQGTLNADQGWVCTVDQSGTLGTTAIPWVQFTNATVGVTSINGNTGALTASGILDYIGSTRGAVLYRSAVGWAVLAPAAAGYLLASGGAGADPTYIAPVPDTSADVARANTDIRLLYLYAAEQRGRSAMQDGIVDAYNDATGINTGASSNYALDATNKLIGPTLTGFIYLSNIATGAQAISSGDNASFPKANAFDGNTATIWIASATFSATSGVAYLGQTFSTAQRIRRVTYTNDASTGAVASVLIQYADGGAWTTAATSTGASTATGATVSIDVPESGSHTQWRILANSNPSTLSWRLQEATFIPGATVPDTMTLRGVAVASEVTNPGTGRLAVQLAPPVNTVAPGGATVTVNTDLIGSVSRDGTTFTNVTLTAQQVLADGTTEYEGTVSLSGQPTGSSMAYRFVSANNKDTRISGVVFQWGA